jgi:hypothetical protein
MALITKDYQHKELAAGDIQRIHDVVFMTEDQDPVSGEAL